MDQPCSCPANDKLAKTQNPPCLMWVKADLGPVQ